MTDIVKGSKAPEFCLKDQDEKETCLSSFAGKFLILYFYPKDNTSGCTLEAMDFTAQLPKFEAADAPVLGISPDSPKSHRGFIEKHQLKLTLLSDEKHEALEDYGVWKKKVLYGKEHLGVERSTFIIGPRGKVMAVWRKVKVPGHVDEVLTTLGQLQKG
jgi:peroxiredoxin Q/BCP